MKGNQQPGGMDPSVKAVRNDLHGHELVLMTSVYLLLWKVFGGQPNLMICFNWLAVIACPHISIMSNKPRSCSMLVDVGTPPTALDSSRSRW